MKEELHVTELRSSAILGYRDRFLCVLIENGLGLEERRWFPVRMAEYAEVQTLLGHPVTRVNQEEGIYVDEEGTVFQLADRGETKPIAVEPLALNEKSELEALLEASLKGGKESAPNADSKRVHRRVRNNSRRNKQHSLQVVERAAESVGTEAPATAETSHAAVDAEVPNAQLQLNLRQKLAEVRRRIGYARPRRAAGPAGSSCARPVLIDHSIREVLKGASPMIIGASLAPIPCLRQRCHSGVFCCSRSILGMNGLPVGALGQLAVQHFQCALVR